MPTSFAPLAKRADTAVATVKARVEKETALGRRRTVAEGLGTAFVYDPEGYLLTNNHVIEDATDISVGFVDGKYLKASIIGRDKPTDIAVLKVDEKGLAALPLGDSDAVEVGDWVVAIGNPFGLSHTVSAGILSAKGRTRDDVKGLDPSGYFNFLQTDASINPGNSGGPLLNIKGEVVGINAAVRANANNIGFAIPINQVRAVLPQLKSRGRVARGFIGVTLETVTPAMRQALGLASAGGAIVQEVTQDTPGERAGLRAYDVIRSVDGVDVTSSDELIRDVSGRSPGSTAKLQVMRDGREQEILVKLAERPASEAAPEEPAPVQPADAEQAPLGMVVRDLDVATARRSGLPAGLVGVVVLRVDPASVAQVARVRRNMVILEINRRRVQSAAEYQRIIARAQPGEVLALYVYDPLSDQRSILTLTIESN